MTFLEPFAVYLIFLLLISLIGRGSVILYQKISKKYFKKILGIEIFYLYIFIGLFVASNIIFILNFFIPSNSKFVLVMLLLIIFLNLFRISKIKLDIQKILILFSTPLVASIYNNNGSTDSFMYHFANQKIIYHEKIVIGISNLTTTLGYGSLFEYISSLLWIGENYMYVQLVNLALIASLFHLLIFMFSSNKNLLKNSSILILIVGFLDNFGFSGGRNGFIFIQEVGKFDSSFGIIFLFSFLVIMIIAFEKNIKDYEIHFSFLLITFLLQIKPFGYILFLPLIFVLLLKKDKALLLNIFNNYLFFIINSLWILKSFLNTSCLVYPIQITCFSNMSWHFPNQAKYISFIATSNNRNPNKYVQEIFNFEWIFEFWLKENYSYILNSFFTILLLLVVFKQKNILKLKNEEKILLIFCFLYLFMWFFLFPNYRFIVGYLLSFYLILFSRQLNLPIKNIFRIFYNKNIFYGMLVVVFLFTVRIDSYKTFFENYNLNLKEKYTLSPQSYIKKNDSFGYIPENFYCFTNTECSISGQKINKLYKYTYKIYEPINKELHTLFINKNNKKGM